MNLPIACRKRKGATHPLVLSLNFAGILLCLLSAIASLSLARAHLSGASVLARRTGSNLDRRHVTPVTISDNWRRSSIVESRSIALENVNRTSYSLNSRLYPRYDDRKTTTWDHAICRADRMLSMMNNWQHNPTTFDDPKELEDWGYEITAFARNNDRQTHLGQYLHTATYSSVLTLLSDDLMDMLKVPRVGPSYYLFSVLLRHVKTFPFVGIIIDTSSPTTVPPTRRLKVMPNISSL